MGSKHKNKTLKASPFNINTVDEPVRISGVQILDLVRAVGAAELEPSTTYMYPLTSLECPEGIFEIKTGDEWISFVDSYAWPSLVSFCKSNHIPMPSANTPPEIALAQVEMDEAGGFSGSFTPEQLWGREALETEEPRPVSNAKGQVATLRAVIVFYNPMTGSGQLKTPNGDPFEFRVECVGAPFRVGEDVTFVKEGDHATRVRRESAAGTTPELTPEDSRTIGSVTKLFSDKQFGFVEGVDGSKAFLHYSEARGVDLTVGLPVSYIVRPGAKGLKAHKIRLCTSDELATLSAKVRS